MRVVHIAPGFDVEVLETTAQRSRIVRLVSEHGTNAAIERHGHIPLPPYIARAAGADDGHSHDRRQPGRPVEPQPQR